MKKLLYSSALILCAVAAFAHDEEEELYRSWNDPANTHELILQTVGMVIILVALAVIRYRMRRIR